MNHHLDETSRGTAGNAVPDSPNIVPGWLKFFCFALFMTPAVLAGISDNPRVDAFGLLWPFLMAAALILALVIGARRADEGEIWGKSGDSPVFPSAQFKQ